MAAQTKYGYFTVKGSAGGIVDLAPYAIDSFINESANGVLSFGMGVVTGTKAGVNVKAPSATGDKFEGIITNRRSTERGLEGELVLREKAAVGVMKYGRIWGALCDSVEPAYGDAVYLVVSGDEAGCFTKTSGSNTMAINGRFLSGADNGCAIIELMSADVV